MAKRQLPSPETLRQLLRYEPETGKLFWRERGPEWFKGGQSLGDAKKTWNKRFSGKEAFTAVCGSGYHHGTVFGSFLMAHRVSWAVYYGRWPDNEIDHINCNKLDNRICNLREATRSENQRNTRVHKDSKSGVKGVYYYPPTKRWVAKIRVNGVNTHIGYFETMELARDAYRDADKRFNGEFANG